MQIDRVDNFMRSLDVEAYRVGGSVRDEILERPTKDADYMVRGVSLRSLGSLLRDSVQHIDRGDVKPLVLRDGRQAGWRVSGRGMGLVEIVLPRTEVSTGPGHRDFAIEIDPSITLEEDAQRRDFTFNALYKIVHAGRSSLVALPNGRIAENIIDPLGGIDDLMRRKVRVTHFNSFRDDPLRTLRALRFVSVLGYDLDDETYLHMLMNHDAVTGLTMNGYASATVYEEMSKILMGASVMKALRLARDTGVLGKLFPELEPMLGFEQESRYHDRTTDEHTFLSLDTAAKVDAPLRVRWALLFHDAGKPEAAWKGDDGRLHYYAKNGTEDHQVVGERLWRGVAARLTGVPKDVREDVARLIRNHMVNTADRFKASSIRRMRAEFGDDLLRDLFMHRACDVSGKGTPDRNTLERIGRMEATRQEAARRGCPCKVTDLEVNGRDAKEVGLVGGDIGRALRSVLLEVASDPNPVTLTRDWQMGRLSAWKSS